MLIDWPQVVSAGCTVVITLVINRLAKALKDVATKQFVTTALAAHGDRLKVEVSEMFVRSSIQDRVNSEVEHRVNRVEHDLADLRHLHKASKEAAAH